MAWASAPALAHAAGSSEATAAPRPFVAVSAAPDILGTTAQPIRADRFAAIIHHVFADASGSPLMQRLIGPALSLKPAEQLAFVQSRVSHNIRWVSDATEWGQHDYWASAEETLARGAGDMEDRAIVKMQALRALGFNPSDLFLTLARDRVGGPMTVLIVRLGKRYFVLDDTGGQPFPVDERRFEFQPVISFGWNGTWVHTRPTTTPPAIMGAGAFARK